MRTFKDTDILEALQRKFADTPQVPNDLSERLLRRIDKVEEAIPTHRKLYIALRWMAVAAVLVAVLALFTWKSQTPKTLPQIAKHENTPKVIEKDSVVKSPTTHVMIANDTREVEQQHTRRLKTSQPKKKNEEETKEQNTPVEEPLLAEAEPIQEERKQEYQSIVPAVPTQSEDLEPRFLAASQAQDIRSRGERLSREVALLIEQ